MINNIESITMSYIYYIDGKKVSNKSNLQIVLDALKSDYIFYSAMYEDVQATYNKYDAEVNDIKDKMDAMQHYINVHNDEPMIKRGYADICYRLDATREEYNTKFNELNGIHIVLSNTLDKITKINNYIAFCKKLLMSV